jgi:hypothetical protein
MAPAMGTIRAFCREHRRFAALLIVLALAIKALVPSGYMPTMTGQVLTVAICADASGGALTRRIVLPADDKPGAHGKGEGHCPYAALGMAGLPGMDAVLLTLALSFILARGFAPVRPVRPARASFLRPPLRGPPARA